MRTALICAAVLLGMAAQASAQSPFSTVAEMIEARAKATPADREFATGMLSGADNSAKRGNWSGAYKGYAEAALVWPDTASLLGMTEALAKMKRDADGCENGFRVKLSDLSRAFRVLVLLQQLGEVDGAQPDTSDVRAAIAKAQATVFANIDACGQD